MRCPRNRVNFNVWNCVDRLNACDGMSPQLDHCGFEGSPRTCLKAENGIQEGPICEMRFSKRS
jgi:hypothetical protein